MRTRRYPGVLVALLLLLGLAGPVQAGAWATIELAEPVGEIVSGDVVVLNITVLQHGETPARYDDLVVTAVHAESGSSQIVDAEQTEMTGLYEAQVLFDQPGRWKVRGDMPGIGIGTAFPTLFVHADRVDMTASPVSSRDAADDVVEVNIMGGTFHPGLTRIETGAIVRFTNNDSIKHEVAFADLGIDDSGILEPGGSFEVTFDAPGSYLFVCGPHRGMSGTIEVTP